MTDIERAIQAVEACFAVAVGNPRRLDAALADLDAALAANTASAPGAPDAVLARVAALLARRVGPLARTLLAWVAGHAGAVTDVTSLLSGLLAVRDPALIADAVDALLAACERGAAAPGLDVVAALADRVEEADDDSPLRGAALLERIEPLLGRLPAADLPAADRRGASAAERLFLGSSAPRLRQLAARILDRSGDPVPPDRAAAAVGNAAADLLAPYFAYARATHLDLVAITPVPGDCPPCLASLAETERVLGQPLLATVVGQLGWSRITWGLAAERLVGVVVEGSFPLALAPVEARLLEASAADVRRAWDRFLITAHGGTVEAGRPDGSDDAIQRFRRYNLAHAAALDLILEIAPVTPEKTRRIFGLMDRITADYAALFAEHTEEAARLAGRWAGMKARVVATLDGVSDLEPLAPEPTRLVQMFEDPRSLDEVTTVHGLKRYLHQRGLRLAFKLFRSARTTNRSVDLVVTDEKRILETVAAIRYLDFEPELDFESGTGHLDLPYPVALAADAFGRQLVHGLARLPAVEILRYGNEVQVYVKYRNHPAFLRLDLSPPLKGGMVDLEYFGVSQYELDHHPDVTVPAISTLMGRLDFDVERIGTRLHARYDKERSFDLGDLTDKAAALFRLTPYLMDVDWILGSLEHTPAARANVAEAWAAFFVRWGVLPMEAFVTADRRKILTALAPDPAGEREVPWNGRGDYRDRFTGLPRAALLDRLREELEARGLGQLADWPAEAGEGPALLPLERAVFGPLRRAIRRGEAVVVGDDIRAAPEARFAREHEAEWLAAVIVAGGDALERAARLADVVASIERQFRFHTTGSVQGYPVQRAVLPLRGERVSLFVLRDERGRAALALAAADEVLYRSRQDAGAHWRRGGELDSGELVRRLRRDSYLTEGVDCGGDAAAEPAAQRAARLRIPNRTSEEAPLPDDRIVSGISAAPGRAAGFARFSAEGREPEAFAGAVMIAPVMRPEDAPWLRRAAAIVSTGGGILSHVGLIALELKKPALIISGHWRDEPGGVRALVCRRPVFREDEVRVGDLQVVRRRDLREQEEVIREGDLVAVDADTGTLAVLGQDPDALALQQDLGQMRDAAARLAAAGEPGEMLVNRGRLLRAVHQLEKLLGRVDRPVLARHAVRELLEVPEAAQGVEGQTMRGRLLAALFANRAVGEAARHGAHRRHGELARRHVARAWETIRVIPGLASFFEVLYLRMEVAGLERMVRATGTLLEDCGLTIRVDEVPPDIEPKVRERLEQMAAELRREIAAARGTGADRSGLRGRLVLAEYLDATLGGRRFAEVGVTHADDAAVTSALVERRVLGPGDGGIELRALVGGKAATLGEMVRNLGAERVPEWFTLTDHAFREMLACPAPAHALEAVGIEPSVVTTAAGMTLGAAVEAVLAREAWDAGQRSAAVRELWQAVELPAALEAELLAAYRALAGADLATGDTDSDAGSGSDAGKAEPFVAIRSSAFEEDAESAAWAGQFDTFLYVRGAGAVIAHLKLAWAGLWSERALDRRRMLGESGTPAGGGVIVQRMVNARVSGVLHTVAAAAGSLGEMVINVGLGLGEGVVSGTVDVDQVVVEKEGGAARPPLHFRYRIGDKREQVVRDPRTGEGTRRVETRYHERLRPALEYVELAELVGTAEKLERIHGLPIDVEFAIEDSSLYILQARPITVFFTAWRDTLDHLPLASVPAA